MIVADLEGFGKCPTEEYGALEACDKWDVRAVNEIIRQGGKLSEADLAFHAKCQAAGQKGSIFSKVDWDALLGAGTDIAKTGVQSYIGGKTAENIANIQADAYKTSMLNFAKLQQGINPALPTNQAVANNPSVMSQILPPLMSSIFGQAHTGAGGSAGTYTGTTAAALAAQQAQMKAAQQAEQAAIAAQKAEEFKKLLLYGGLGMTAIMAAVLIMTARKEGVPVMQVAQRYLPGRR